MQPVAPRLRCLHCADIIGAYEPMVLEAPHGPRHTSLAAEPELYRAEPRCFHRACHAEADQRDL